MAIATALLFLSLAASLLAHTREVTFPPVSGFSQQRFLGEDEADLLSGSEFAGLTTYASLPYVHCLAGDGEEVEKYDIAILGAPFDTVG